MTISNRARSYLLVSLCMVAYLWMGEAMAGTSGCYAIKDQDSRNYWEPLKTAAFSQPQAQAA